MHGLARSLQSVVQSLACFLLLLSWWLPSHFRPWATAYQELLAALGLTLLGLSVLFHRGCRVPCAAALLCILAAVPLLQLLIGVLTYAGDAWVSTGYILAFSLAFMVGFNLHGEGGAQPGAPFIEQFAWTLLLGCLLSAVLAVMQWLGFSHFEWISPIQDSTRPFANLAQPNNLATLLGMGLMSLLFLFERYRVPRLVAVLLGLFLLFVLALTQSRTPWVTAVFVGGFWFCQQKKLVLRVTSRQMLLWLLIYTAMVVSVPLLNEYLAIGSGSLMDRLQQAARWSMHKQFFHAVLQGPWYGYGWNQVFVAQAAISPEYAHYEPTFYSHNVLLDLLIWNGPLLGGFIILLTVVWFWRLLCRAGTLTSTYAWLALSCFIVHSMLEYPHAYLFLLIPAGLLLGVLQASIPVGMAFRLPRAAGCLLAGLAVLMTIVNWRDYHLIELEHQRALLETHEEFLPREQQDVTEVHVLTHMREYIYFIRAPLRADYSAEQLDELLAVTGRFPHFYFLLKTAYILAINDREDEAHGLLLLIGSLHQQPKLEQSLAYLLEKSEEHPELSGLLLRFGVRR